LGDEVLATFSRGAFPLYARKFGASGQHSPLLVLRRGDFYWEEQPDPESYFLPALVPDYQIDGGFTILPHAYNCICPYCDVSQSAGRQDCIHDCREPDGGNQCIAQDLPTRYNGSQGGRHYHRAN